MKRALVFALSASLALGTVTPVFGDNGDYPTENGYEVTDYEDDEADADEVAEEAADVEEVTEEVAEEAAQATAEEAVEETSEEIETDEALPALPPAIGKIGYITNYADHQLTVAGLLDEEDIIVLNLGDATVVIDAETGAPAVIADRENDRVKVYHAVFTTMSIPPQSPALVVAINLPEHAGSPHYHVIDAIEHVDEDTVRLTVDNDALIITLDREAPLSPHLTRQLVTIDTLSVGDTVLFWYEVVADSIPGQTTATRALWLSAAPAVDTDIEVVGDEENGYIGVVTLPADISGLDLPESAATLPAPIEAVPTDEYIAIQPIGIAVAGTGVVRDGVEFFPVRALAVEAGFAVAWDAATRSAILTTDSITISVTDNAATFVVDGATYTLSAAAVIINDVMYAPAELFAHLG